jgi:exonuclease SbcD
MSFRILHAADLHLGQKFHDHDRGPDEEHALSQLRQWVREHEVDVVVLAGDIFDVAHPGAREVQRYHRFLAGLALEDGVGSVVVIAGNHDHPMRIEGPRQIFELARIHTRGAWPLDAEPQQCIVELRGRSGDIVGRALAVPFLREGDVRRRLPGEDSSLAANAHVAALEERLGQLHAAVPSDGLPLVVVAHAFATGGSFGGGERPIQVGNEARVPAAAFAGDAAYLALGHLHRSQQVAGQAHWRYPGSLLPTGFDELETPRRALLVDVPDEGAAQVQELELRDHRRLERLQGTGPELERMLLELERPSEEDPVPWVRAYALLDRPEPGLGQRLSDLATQRGWQLLGVELGARRSAEERQAGASEPFEAPRLDLSDCNVVFGEILQSRDYAPEVLESLWQSFRELQEHCDELLEEAN